MTLVGATTENPSFELNGALLSRCQVFVLQAAGRCGAGASCWPRPRPSRSAALPLDAGGARGPDAPWPTATAAMC